MCCAIRPGDLYFDETCNTLKYADRAKKLRTKPTINEDPQDKIIRELREENELLKKGLGGGGGSDPEAKKKLQEAEEQMKRNQQMLEEMTKSYEDRLNEANSA